MSEKNIYQKLAEFQGMGIAFEKTANNPFFKSKYTPLDDLNKVIKPILTELWLVIVHSVHDREVNTIIVNVEDPNEYVECVMTIPEWVIDPQKVGSAVTYFKRYNTVALLNLDSESDNDGNDAKADKKPFDKQAQTKFNEAIVAEKYKLPETVEELYKDLEKRYTLTKKQKEELNSFYITNNTNDQPKD